MRVGYYIWLCWIGPAEAGDRESLGETGLVQVPERQRREQLAWQVEQRNTALSNQGEHEIKLR